MMLEDAAQPEVWHRCKTAITKSGVAVPLLFRVAVSTDAKNPLKQHKRRGLWKMPVRQALEVVQSGADVEDAGGPPEAPRPRGRGSAQGRRGKRGRLDDDGDVIMVRAVHVVVAVCACLRQKLACAWSACGPCASACALYALLRHRVPLHCTPD